ncbi:hypothetical protein FQA39_LY16281 [Lamprigera yunnana]|nr:hypothetical protein FQA39_LY16281 [Lamprigera yunnana]
MEGKKKRTGNFTLGENRVSSDVDDHTNAISKRKRKATHRLYDSSDEEDPIKYNSNKHIKNNLERPPAIKIQNIGIYKLLFHREETSQGGASTSSFSSAKPTGPDDTGFKNVIISTPSSSNEEFIKGKVFILLLYIKEQNNQILKTLDTIQRPVASVSYNFELPKNLPAQFPIKTIEDLEEIEIYLLTSENLTNVSSYFLTLGGKDVTSKTNHILWEILANSLAAKFSFLGTRQEKRAFKDLKLKTVVQFLTSPSDKEKSITDAIKTWLKHAPERHAKEKHSDDQQQFFAYKCSMPKYKQKIIVGKHQLYRHVANECEKILEHEKNLTNSNNLINNEIDSLNQYQRFNENEINFDDSNCSSINRRYSAISEVNNTFYNISNDSEENCNKKDIVEITSKSVNDINSDVDKSEVSVSSQLRNWALKHVSIPHNVSVTSYMFYLNIMMIYH